MSLNKTLAKTAKKMKFRQGQAFTRRVMWKDMANRIDSIFKEISAYPDTDELGGLQISHLPLPVPFIESCEIPYYERTNSIHISAVKRNLKTTAQNEKSRKYEPAYEKNAQLWYSQAPMGQVVVLVAPYKSNAGEVHEKEFIIGRYSEPSRIGTKEIEAHFRKFFRYCSCSSQTGTSNFPDFVYRVYLKYLDFRFRPSFHAAILRGVERIGVFTFSALAAWYAVTELFG